MPSSTHSRPASPPAEILAGKLTATMTFPQKVWTLTAQIPAGRVATYRQIALALNGHAYRAVGQALHNNPYAPAVPCHRVVASNGRLTGYAGGLAKKARLLTKEGVQCSHSKVVDLATHLHHFA